MTRVAEVKISPTKELDALPREFEQTASPDFPAADLTTDQKPDADAVEVLQNVVKRVVARQARAERELIAEGSAEFGDEMLEVTRRARAAQIRALPEE